MRYALALVLLVILALPTNAHAYSYQGERAAPAVVQTLARKADKFWHKRGVPACASTRTVLMAPSLLEDDDHNGDKEISKTSGDVDAVERALRDDCQVWIVNWLVADTLDPQSYGTAIDLCFAIYHGSGHTGALAHSKAGLMKAVGGMVPFECKVWARRFEDRKFVRQVHQRKA